MSWRRTPPDRGSRGAGDRQILRIDGGLRNDTLLVLVDGQERLADVGLGVHDRDRPGLPAIDCAISTGGTAPGALGEAPGLQLGAGGGPTGGHLPPPRHPGPCGARRDA
jgi:hypothetical protein